MSDPSVRRRRWIAVPFADPANGVTQAGFTQIVERGDALPG